jgi:hypothetical protein
MSEDGSPRLPERADVVAMLATFGDREPGAVREELGSLELTWLVAQTEQRYGVELDISDELFAAMGTVTGAVAALRERIVAAHPRAAPAPAVVFADGENGHG